MKMNTLLGAMVLVTWTGCVAAEEDIESAEVSAGGKADGISWQKFMSCENGSVVVDVDVNERRNVQIVLRHDDAINHLKAAADAQWSPQYVIQRNSQGEVILRGTSSRGVFSASDFESMTRDTNYAPVYTARRDYGGLRVALLGTVRLDPPSCRWVDENQGNWVCDEYGFGEFSNWWFSGCVNH